MLSWKILEVEAACGRKSDGESRQTNGGNSLTMFCRRTMYLSGVELRPCVKLGPS